ncbi:hypothetical protein RI054_01g06520 [Pseudoscourfieldia marina]
MQKCQIRLAMFSPNGLGMDLYWRYPSSFVAENPTKDCSALFVAETVGKLGYAPTCEFTTNKVLHVQFGPRATVLPSDDLVTLTNSVQLTCNSAEILDGCANGPVENAMTVQARIPYNAIVPTAIITAPEKVGKCDLAEISARLSQGFAGRSMKYVWGVEGGSVTPELLKAVAAMDTKTIQIPSAYLVQDAMYTFTLQATNYMGKTSIVARADVTKSLDPVPYLVINGLAKAGHHHVDAGDDHHRRSRVFVPRRVGEAGVHVERGGEQPQRDPGYCFAHVARPVHRARHAVSRNVRLHGDGVRRGDARARGCGFGSACCGLKASDCRHQGWRSHHQHQKEPCVGCERVVRSRRRVGCRSTGAGGCREAGHQGCYQAAKSCKESRLVTTINFKD